MENSLKLIVTSKRNLMSKYGDKFSGVENILSDLVKSDAKNNLDTRIVYIDDENSAKAAGITHVKSVTHPSGKKAIDELFNKLNPAYIVLFGADDVFPFQKIVNPTEDEDPDVPSDLPYACETSYSTKIKDFTGPTRVVGRIPDVKGKDDLEYVRSVIYSIINYVPVDADVLYDYFSVSAHEWKKSTQESLSNMFGNNTNLKFSPPSKSGYSNDELKSPIHFFNCHGSPIDSKFYGQDGEDYPDAIDSIELAGKISKGTIVVAECCYGAQLHNPEDSGNKALSMANTYLQNNAIAFMGSSNIAYGPAEGQALADLITQYFIKNILAGASLGRALLEARQTFIAENSLDLEPYELKTLAQFFLLGDPSIRPINVKEAVSGEGSTENDRRNLFSKGLMLSKNVMTPVEVKGKKKGKANLSVDLKKVMANQGFTGKEKQYLYKLKPKKGDSSSSLAKSKMGGNGVTFRAIVQEGKIGKDVGVIQVMVIKKKGEEVLGWRIYKRK